MLVHKETGSLLLHAPDPFYIRDLIPKSKTLDHADYNVALKHTVETTKVLRNIGFDAPAPIHSNYKWPGKYSPFDHQRVMAEFMTMNRRCFNLSEMGTGKTASTLWAADYLMQTGRVRKALVLSPLSTVERVWMHDIYDVLMHRVGVIVHGSKEQREKALKVDADFYILNHDGVSIPWIEQHVRRREDIDLVIVDEGSMFRNWDTEKYKALSRMLRQDQRLWWLTGTPCPNAPTDAWAQTKIVNPSRVDKYYGAFQRRTMYKATQFKWLPKTDAYNIAYEAMQPAVRFKKADCLDLPPVMTEDRQCGLTKQQNKAFFDMKTLMMAEAKERQITAVNAADKINKIRQILCGCVKDPKTGDYLTIPHAPRTTVLLEAIEQASAKVIVIVPFKGIIKDLEKEVAKHSSVAVLNGDVSPKVRDRIIRAFKEDTDPHVLLCHPKVMSHGLNLTEADTLIFYAPIYSNDEYQQVIERFNRTGQTRKMTVIRIGAHPIEWKIYSMVDTKKVTQDNILDLYETVTLET